MIEVKENNQIVTKNYLYSVQCTFYACIIVFIYRRPITTLQSKSEIYSQDWNKGFTIYHEIGINAPPHQSVSMTKRSALCIV